KVRSRENRVGDAADQRLGLGQLRSAPVRHHLGRRRHHSVPPLERRSHPLQRRHVRMSRPVRPQNNSVRRNNSVNHKSKQREPPSSAKLKSAQHNSSANHGTKPQGQ